MKQEIASVAQLKANLSAYLAKARAGTIIEVTAHRKVIALVVGAGSNESTGLPPGLARMAGEGKLRPGNGMPLTLGLPAAVSLAGAGPTLSDLVLQERGLR